MIKRTLQYTISEKLKDRKVIIILGPRQVGKSTLLKLMQKELNSPVAHWNGDEADIRAMLKDPTSTLLKNIIGSNKTIIIGEPVLKRKLQEMWFEKFGVEEEIEELQRRIEELKKKK